MTPVIIWPAEPGDREIAALLAALGPGGKVRWSIGNRGLEAAIERGAPGDVVVACANLEDADRIYLKLLEIQRIEPPWLKPRRRVRP